MSQDPAQDPARARLVAIHAMRWAGVALVIFGLLVLNGRVAIPKEAGYVLLVVGLIDAFVLPTVFARRWRSPRP
jgi:hypothetical protein